MLKLEKFDWMILQLSSGNQKCDWLTEKRRKKILITMHSDSPQKEYKNAQTLPVVNENVSLLV